MSRDYISNKAFIFNNTIVGFNIQRLKEGVWVNDLSNFPDLNIAISWMEGFVELNPRDKFRIYSRVDGCVVYK